MVWYMVKLPPLAARVLPKKNCNNRMTSVKFVFYSVMTTVK